MKTRLKQLREARGLTQAQLAEMAGLSKSYYNELETGKKVINHRRIVELAKTLNVPASEIISDPADKASPVGKPVSEIMETVRPDPLRAELLFLIGELRDPELEIVLAAVKGIHARSKQTESR